MNEHEIRIKEQRTVQANQKNLMGFDGKIGCVVRNMGKPIVSQNRGGTYFNSTPGYDFYETLEDDEIGGSPEDIARQLPVFDIEGVEQPEGDIWMERSESIIENTEKIGWHFDGLNRGMHLEIKYINEEKELSVSYKGYTVYKEIAGDLISYVPDKGWESMIDKLHLVAKKIQLSRNKTEKEANKQILKRQKESWLQKMKNKWGL